MIFIVLVVVYIAIRVLSHSQKREMSITIGDYHTTVYHTTPEEDRRARLIQLRDQARRGPISMKRMSKIIEELKKMD